MDAVKNAVKSTKPDTIISTACIGYTNKISKLKQILNPAIVEALQEDRRLSACKFIDICGATSPVPPDQGDVTSSFMGNLVYMINLKGAVYDNSAANRHIVLTPMELNYTMVMLGKVGESQSKGTLFGIVAKTGDYGELQSFIY